MNRLTAIALAAALAQGPTLPFGFVPQPTGGGITPTIIQVIPAVTNGGAATTCTGFATNPSFTCVMASLGAGHYLIYSSVTPNTITTFNAPTGTGAGCTGLTWTAVGTANSHGALFISSVTSAGACTLTISASSAGGVTLQGVIREVTTTSHTIETGTGISLGLAITSCTTCAAPNAATTITTTVANDLVMCDAIAGGAAGAMTMTGTYSTDINTSGGDPEIGGHVGQAVAGVAAKMTWTGSSSAYDSNCYALEP